MISHRAGPTVGLALVALLVAACGGSVADEPGVDGNAAENAAVSVGGPPIAEWDGGGISGDPGADPAIGTTAPSLSGTDFDDSPVSIAADGRPKAVYFLAHWCSHCRDEVEVITELVADGRQPADIDVYAVAIAVRDDQPNYPPSEWLAEFPGSVMRDSVNDDAAMATGVSGIPYALYLDGQNTIVARSVGSLSAEQIESLWIALADSRS